MTSRVWLNGEFHTKPWTQTGLSKAPESPPDQIEDEVSDLEPSCQVTKEGRGSNKPFPSTEASRVAFEIVGVILACAH